MSVLAAIGAGLGIGKLITDIVVGNKNERLEKEKFEYDKELQQQIFSREDNAVQRSAADFEAAGLSKTLAAGNSARAGAVVSTSAPQFRQDLKFDQVEKVLGIKAGEIAVKQGQENISKTQEENKYIKLQQDKIIEDTRFMKEMNPLRKEEQTFSNLFADRTLEIRVKQVRETANQTVIRNENIRLDNQLKKYQMSESASRKALNIIKKEYTQGQKKLLLADLGIKQQEILYKETLVQILELQKRGIKLDSQMYQTLGLGPEAIKLILGRIDKLGGFVTKLVGKVLK